jgi:hypothetical protein
MAWSLFQLFMKLAPTVGGVVTATQQVARLCNWIQNSPKNVRRSETGSFLICGNAYELVIYYIKLTLGSFISLTEEETWRY